MSLTAQEKACLEKIESYIHPMITQFFRTYVEMLMYREIVLSRCYKALEYLEYRCSMSSSKVIEILYKAYDQEENKKQEKLLYCFFYIAYCQYVADRGNVPEESAKKQSVEPKIIIFSDDSPSTPPTGPAPLPPPPPPNKSSIKPPYNPDILPELEERIKELENALKTHDSRVNELEKRSQKRRSFFF